MSLPAGVGASAKVTVRAVNRFGELLGPDADLTASVSEGLYASSLEPEEYGTHALSIEPGFYGGTHSVEVFASGTSIGEVELEVVGPQAPATPFEVGVSEPDTSGAESLSEPVTPPADSGGCSAREPGHIPWVLLAGCFFALGLLRRRQPLP